MQKIKTINEIGLYAATINILEYLLLIIPNVSFTPLLFAIYFTNRDFKNSTILVFVYMSLQVILWGFGLWILPMSLGWLFLILVVKRFKKVPLHFKTIIFAYFYGLLFMPMTVLVYGLSWVLYIVSDFPFATLMAVSNFITFYWLFEPLSKFFSVYSKNGS